MEAEGQPWSPCPGPRVGGSLGARETVPRLRMSRPPTTTLLGLVFAALLVATGTSGAATTAAPRVTMVADSVGGVLFWDRDAREDLSRGMDFRIDIRTCRRLVTEGCVYDGGRPPSALDAIREIGPALGSVVVIDVGYNDAPEGYGAALDRVMHALLDEGVQRVVWVTLRERRPSWAEINDEIRDGAKRWPQITVGEWDRESTGHDDWFADGIHMTADGGAGFARFIRPLVVDACSASCPPDDAMLVVRTDRLRMGRVNAPYAARLVAAGGTRPYRWSVEGLPKRLHMLPDGRISGRPRTAGTYSLTVEVVDRARVRNRAAVELRVVTRSPASVG